MDTLDYFLDAVYHRLVETRSKFRHCFMSDIHVFIQFTIPLFKVPSMLLFLLKRIRRTESVNKNQTNAYEMQEISDRSTVPSSPALDPSLNTAEAEYDSVNLHVSSARRRSTIKY